MSAPSRPLSFRRPGPGLLRARAFTLVEVLVAVTVLGVVTAGLLRVFVQLLSVYQYDNGKVMVNRDFRQLTAELLDRAAYANECRIYPAASSLDRGASPQTPGADGAFGAAIGVTPITTGSGDVLVLVQRDATNLARISRIVVYYARTRPGPLRRIERTFSPSSDASVENLIPSIPSPDSDNSPVVVEKISGLNTGNGLFGRLTDRSVVVRGTVVHRGGMRGTRNATASNIYGLVISPRG